MPGDEHGGPPGGYQVASVDIYQAFVDWWTVTETKDPITSTKFIQELKARGYGTVRWKAEGKQVRGIRGVALLQSHGGAWH